MQYQKAGTTPSRTEIIADELKGGESAKNTADVLLNNLIRWQQHRLIVAWMKSIFGDGKVIRSP